MTKPTNQYLDYRRKRVKTTLPTRCYDAVEDLKQDWSAESQILINATEQRIQRPVNQQHQKQYYSGKKHPCWFDEHDLHVDLGFQGIEKDYAPHKVSIPIKKSKNKPLTQQCRKSNKNKSSIWVKVEYSIDEPKRYSFLADRLRCQDI